MKPFLEKIAERLIRKFPENMDSISVVLPSKRSVVFLKNYLSTKISKPIFLPMFFSIEEFIENISGLKVLDNVSLQFYLYQSYLDSSQGKVDSFSEFLDLIEQSIPSIKSSIYVKSSFSEPSPFIIILDLFNAFSIKICPTLLLIHLSPYNAEGLMIV